MRCRHSICRSRESRRACRIGPSPIRTPIRADISFRGCGIAGQPGAAAAISAPLPLPLFRRGSSQRVARRHSSRPFCRAHFHAAGGLLLYYARLLLCREDDGSQLFCRFRDLFISRQLGKRLEKTKRRGTEADTQPASNAGRRTHRGAAAIRQRTPGKRAAHSAAHRSDSSARAESRFGTFTGNRPCRSPARTGARRSRRLHNLGVEVRFLLHLRARR